MTLWPHTTYPATTVYVVRYKIRKVVVHNVSGLKKLIGVFIYQNKHHVLLIGMVKRFDTHCVCVFVKIDKYMYQYKKFELVWHKTGFAFIFIAIKNIFTFHKKCYIKKH